jgi:hypothetical protein
MLAVIIILAVIIVVAFKFLSYLNGMCILEKQLQKDQFTQLRHKALMTNYRNKTYSCANCVRKGKQL